MNLSINTELLNVAVLRHHRFMQWIVEYKQFDMDRTVRAVTPEDAIRTACQLLDDGYDVCAIGVGGSSTPVIEREEIVHLHDLWVRAKPPYSSWWRGR